VADLGFSREGKKVGAAAARPPSPLEPPLPGNKTCIKPATNAATIIPKSFTSADQANDPM